MLDVLLEKGPCPLCGSPLCRLWLFGRVFSFPHLLFPPKGPFFSARRRGHCFSPSTFPPAPPSQLGFFSPLEKAFSPPPIGTSPQHPLFWAFPLQRSFLFFLNMDNHSFSAVFPLVFFLYPTRCFFTGRCYVCFDFTMCPHCRLSFCAFCLVGRDLAGPFFLGPSFP